MLLDLPVLSFTLSPQNSCDYRMVTIQVSTQCQLRDNGLQVWVDARGCGGHAEPVTKDELARHPRRAKIHESLTWVIDITFTTTDLSKFLSPISEILGFAE